MERLVDLSRLEPSDTVLEIGPGKGLITEVLAEKVSHVIAIEKDVRIAEQLCRSGRLPRNVTLYCADALEFPLPTTSFRVFANIPFRHTAAIVGKLTTGTAPPLDSHLVVQKEAAERYLIRPESTLVSQLLFPFQEVSITHSFARQDFTPAPRVDTVMLHISRRTEPLIAMRARERFDHFVTACYTAWQPTFKQAVKSALPRIAAGTVLGKMVSRGRLMNRVSQIPSSDWILAFQILESLDDERVWNGLRQAYSRLQDDRGKLERPTRTRSH